MFSTTVPIMYSVVLYRTIGLIHFSRLLIHFSRQNEVFEGFSSD
jgi:hypothetical protein